MLVRHSRGVTLIELMVVVSMIAVLLALAGPSFKRMIDMQRLRAVHNQIVTDLQFARSEALLRRVPVHIAVRPQSGSTGACYVIFEDQNRTFPFSTACDCSQPAGSRCANPNGTDQATEIRTVQLDRSLGIDLSVPIVARHGYDSESGALLVRAGDSAATTFIRRFSIESFLDSTRKFRAAVEYSGRVTTCAPSGSSVGSPACP